MLVRRTLPSFRPALRPKPRHAVRHQSSNQTTSAKPAKPASAPATTAASLSHPQSRSRPHLDRLPQRLSLGARRRREGGALFSRKGWFGFEAADRGAVAGAFARSGDAEAGDTRGQLEQWQRDDERYKVVVEVALAWAVTKALLPARIILSVWGTPGTVALWKKIIRRGR
ncbi:predicted protein [Verticillium alfalfae VaMs.102]|uniref:Predicted protein n=1 Tax=Verticillium alfalfae (strain VaMs.102 / ATCC MYA-4576 / FGSC 10136) TaxID=526221 RepID=C9SRZ4_VERA1|nr:predicted protein [Verticillium alfalfae VaMs.102]EEY21559.1 predicted protein [Verticillium alfalfae VaMs.102]